MPTFTLRPIKNSEKAAAYFSKMHSELNIEKYKLDKYRELFALASFQNMHDADLAYFYIYHKCADNAQSKKHLLHCLEQEEKLLITHPDAIDADTYHLHTLNAINDIKQQIKSGLIDHLYS